MKKLLILSLIILFSLSLLPMPASATYAGSSSNALKAGSLVKAKNNSVYYFGSDGKRYVFPNQKTYDTWYVDFNLIITISDELLGEIQIGGNVTYRPGKRLIKITTDPKVYYVDKQGTLRWVKTESVAIQLWGSGWASMVDDVPDPFFINYQIGAPLETPEVTTIKKTYSINFDKQISNDPDPDINSIGKIDLSGYVEGTKAVLKWNPLNFTAEKGFKVVKSTQPNPVYPGNDYHYLSDPNTRSDYWKSLAPGTYYFRVCEYLGSKCGVYSDNLALTVAGTVTDNSNGKINLTGYYDEAYGKVRLSWTLNDLYSYKGFKVVKSTNVNPVYPGNDYHYLSDPGVRADKWVGLSAGTYHFRVCEYLGGSCGVYSNDISVTVPGTVTNNSNGSINLTGYYDSSVGKVRLEWNVSNMYSTKGFKVVNSLNANPVYPGNDYHYKSSPDVRTDKWYGLPSGNNHFRVCEYLGGACGVYSNDITVYVP